MRVGVALAAALGCALLTACGGGGGGGGGGNNGGGSPPTSISLDKNRVDLFYAQPGGADAQEITVTFKGAGVAVGTRPGETLPSWLFVGSPTVVNSTTVTVRVSFTPTEYQPQRWSTTLRIAAADENGNNVVYRDLAVTGTIDHELSSQFELLTWPLGASTTPAAAIDVITQNATWEATSDSPWLQVSPASGTGAQTLSVSTTPGSLVEGDYTGTITVRDTLTEHSRTAIVALGVDPRRLETDKRGLAFTSTLGATRLTHTTRVIDTAGLNGKWTATSDAAWLTPSASSGAGGSTLTLAADPAGLADGMHYATLTLAPDDEPGLTNTTTVRAGFYVDRTHPASNPNFNLDTGPISGVMDPIRPYFYSRGGTFPDTVLNVWNVYTGELIDALPIPGSFPSDVAISADGSVMLIVLDSTTMQPVALADDSRTQGAPWSGLQASAGLERVVITRIAGADVAVRGAGQLLSLADGASLGIFPTGQFLQQGTPRFITASPDGRAVFLAGESVGNHRLVRLALGHRANRFYATVTRDINEPGNGNPMAVDSTSTYLFSGGDRLNRYDASNLTVQRTAVSANGGEVELLEDGRVYVGIGHGEFIHLDFDLNEVGRTTFGTSFFYGASISSDEQRVFVVTASGSMFTDLIL